MAAAPNQKEVAALKLTAALIGHLGAKEFIQLTGAHMIRPIEYGARFRLPNYLAQKQINRVEVAVGVDGLIAMTFSRRIKVNGKSVETTIAHKAGIAPEKMAAVFTEVTGLATEVL